MNTDVKQLAGLSTAAPVIQAPGDAVARLTAGAAVIEAVGDEVRSLKPGDRVVPQQPLCCGACRRCRRAEYSQCDEPRSRPAAGLLRVPLADVNLVKLPDEIDENVAALLSDLFPTGYAAAKNAGVVPGNAVAVFGCGPVGLFAIVGAKLLGAARVFAVDGSPELLSLARELGAVLVDASQEDPVAALARLTWEIGPDRVIGAGPFPEQTLEWAVDAVCKGGVVSIVGVYDNLHRFPIGRAMEKSLTLRMGHCAQRRYLEELVDLLRLGIVDPAPFTRFAPAEQAAAAVAV